MNATRDRRSVGPATRQMDWVLGRLLRGEDLAESVLRARFTDEFFRAVPETDLRLMALGLAEDFNTITAHDLLITDHTHLTEVQCASGGRYNIHVTVHDQAPHAIAGLVLVPVDMPAAADVVLLNGASSSGKTSLAKALQDRLPGPWLHVAIDDFQQMASNLQHGIRIVHGFHGSVGALAKAGNRLIVDHLMQDRGWAAELASALDATPVLVVGLTCPVDVLEARERERGDRQPGIAAGQIHQVHGHLVYDLEIDTSTTSIEAAADMVAGMLEGRALAPLRDHLPAGGA